MSYVNAWLENGALKTMLESENRGTNINNLNQEILRKIKIYMPSLGEQEKILRVLDCYNDIISKLDNLIENKMQQKNGLC
ncbi:MAG: restriction endonuclease subunit S [Lachnospiraceae bacterium]|nr:restriction endonuclease subunit S [Lachnospiraceae bacterium]